jgi:hypothetical protein
LTRSKALKLTWWGSLVQNKVERLGSMKSGCFSSMQQGFVRLGFAHWSWSPLCVFQLLEGFHGRPQGCEAGQGHPSRNMFAVVKTLIEFEGESIFLHLMTWDLGNEILLVATNTDWRCNRSQVTVNPIGGLFVRQVHRTLKNWVCWRNAHSEINERLVSDMTKKLFPSLVQAGTALGGVPQWHNDPERSRLYDVAIHSNSQWRWPVAFFAMKSPMKMEVFVAKSK